MGRESIGIVFQYIYKGKPRNPFGIIVQINSDFMIDLWFYDC